MADTLGAKRRKQRCIAPQGDIRREAPSNCYFVDTCRDCGGSGRDVSAVDLPFPTCDSSKLPQVGWLYAVFAAVLIVRPMGSVGSISVCEGPDYSVFDVIQSIAAIKTPDTMKVR
jgi:hypothetical protein